jgi:hypothetical protein
MDWKFAEARKNFSEVISKVLLKGSQRVVRREQTLEEKEYQKLTGQRQSLQDYLLADEPSLDDLDLCRDRSSMRDPDL